MLPERFLYTLRALYPDHSAKFEDPREEGRAHGDFGFEAEVVLIHWCCLHLVAEMVDDRVHGTIFTEKRHSFMIGIEHAKGFFGECADAVALRLFHGGLFLEFRRFRDPIHTEDGDLVMLFGPANHIIEVTVLGQSIRAEDIGFTPVLQLPTFGSAIFEVTETYLHSHINCHIKCVQDLITSFILGLHTVS